LYYPGDFAEVKGGAQSKKGAKEWPGRGPGFGSRQFCGIRTAEGFAEGFSVFSRLYVDACPRIVFCVESGIGKSGCSGFSPELDIFSPD